MTLTLTLDRVILHTIMHHSSTSTYIPNSIEIEETFCGRTDGRTFETGFIRSTRRSRPKKDFVVLKIFSLATNKVNSNFRNRTVFTVQHSCKPHYMLL